MGKLLEVGAVVLIIWSLYDFFYPYFYKWKHKGKCVKVCRLASKMQCVCIGIGIALGVACIALRIIDARPMWLFLGAVCISGASRAFCQSYHVNTK